MKRSKFGICREIMRLGKGCYQNLGNITKYQFLVSPAEYTVYLRTLKNIDIMKLARGMQCILHLRNDAKNSFKSEGNQNVLECLPQYLRCHRRHFYRRHLRWRQCRPRRQQRRFGRRLGTTPSNEGYTHVTQSQKFILRRFRSRCFGSFVCRRQYPASAQ